MMSDIKKVTFAKDKKLKSWAKPSKFCDCLVNDYSFSNDEAETLIDQAVQMNVIRSVLLNGKTS